LSDNAKENSGLPQVFRRPAVMYAGCALTALGFVIVSVSCFFRNELPALPGFLKYVINYYPGLAVAVIGIALSLCSGMPEESRRLPGETRRLSAPVVGAVFFVITLLLFSRTLGIGFLCDDYVQNFVAVHRARGVGYFFSQQVLVGYWRPVAWLEWYCMVSLFGFTPVIFHLTSLVVHALCAMLLFLFMKRAFRLNIEAALAGLLFLLYPASVGTVAWPSCIHDQMTVMFTLLALIFGLNYLRHGGWWRCVLSAAFLCTAPMTKENGFAALPLILLLVILLPACDVSGRACAALNKKVFRRRLALGFAGSITVITIFIIRCCVLGGLVAYRTIPPSAGRHITMLKRALADPRYIFGAWLAPVNRAMYGESIPVIAILLSAICAGIIGFGIILCLRRRRWRLMVFAGAATLFSFLPVFHLLRDLDYQSCARYVYMPTLGVSIILALALAALARRGAPGKAAVLFLVLAWSVMLQLNTTPWTKAGMHCKSLESEARKLVKESGPAAGSYYFLYIPPHVDGAMAFAVGFRTMLVTHAGFPMSANVWTFFPGSAHVPGDFQNDCARFGNGAHLIAYDPDMMTLEDVTPEAAKAYAGADETVTVSGEEFSPRSHDVEIVSPGVFRAGRGGTALLLDRPVPLCGLWKVEIELSVGARHALPLRMKPDESFPVRIRLRGIGKVPGVRGVRMRLSDILVSIDKSGGSGRFSEPVESVFQRGIADSLWLDLPPGPGTWKIEEIRFIYRSCKEIRK